MVFSRVEAFLLPKVTTQSTTGIQTPVHRCMVVAERRSGGMYSIQWPHSLSLLEVDPLWLFPASLPALMGLLVVRMPHPSPLFQADFHIDFVLVFFNVNFAEIRAFEIRSLAVERCVDGRRVGRMPSTRRYLRVDRVDPKTSVMQKILPMFQK